MAGIPVAGAHPGSAELHGAARRAQRRRRSRAGGLPKRALLTILKHVVHAARGVRGGVGEGCVAHMRAWAAPIVVGVICGLCEATHTADMDHDQLGASVPG